MLAESLFRVFDEDKSGSLSFEEWVEASQAPALDTTEEKLSWIFTAFDSDGGGSIDYEEITDICQVELPTMIRELFTITEKTPRSKRHLTHGN